MRNKLVRSKQSLNPAEIHSIIETATYGVLALSGDNEFLYSVPLSYVFKDDAVYFHGAPKGYKFECIRHTDKTSFAIVGQSQVVPALRANNFKSVIIWGRLKSVTDREEKLLALRALADKYSPGIEDNEEEIMNALDYVFIAKLCIESVTGKEAISEVKEAGKKLGSK